MRGCFTGTGLFCTFQILTTTANRLAVLDVETGSQVQTYDDCKCLYSIVDLGEEEEEF